MYIEYNQLNLKAMGTYKGKKISSKKVFSTCGGIFTITKNKVVLMIDTKKTKIE